MQTIDCIRVYCSLLQTLHSWLLAWKWYDWNLDENHWKILGVLFCLINLSEQKTLILLSISCEWSAMRPIEIYCFIALPRHSSLHNEPVLASDWSNEPHTGLWLVSADPSNTVTVVMCPVSRMSRGHKHYCHDKSQNSDTRRINWSQTSIVWETGRNDSGLIHQSQFCCNWLKLKYFLIILSQHPLCDIWTMCCKMSSDIKHPDNRFYWSEGGVMMMWSLL